MTGCNEAALKALGIDELCDMIGKDFSSDLVERESADSVKIPNIKQ